MIVRRLYEVLRCNGPAEDLIFFSMLLWLFLLFVCFSSYMNTFKISLQEEFVWSIHIILLVALKSC